MLRDGASAQYGSDAIAGVVNLRLREADHGGGLTVTYGEYVTSFDGFYGGKHNITDGAAATVAGWQGFKLGSDGFLTVSAQYRDLDPTNRADNDPRVTPSRITGRTGDPKTEDVSVYLNAAKPWPPAGKPMAGTAISSATPTRPPASAWPTTPARTSRRSIPTATCRC